MKKSISIVTLFFFALTFLNLPVNAQRYPDSLERLTKKSDLIITGKVSKKESKWDKTKSRIITNVTIDIEEVLKGSEKSKSLVIGQLGGELDGVGELYTHMPTFYEDEEILVFLKKSPKNGKLHTVDGEKGKITISNNKVENNGYYLGRENIIGIKNSIKKYSSD